MSSGYPPRSQSEYGQIPLGQVLQSGPIHSEMLDQQVIHRDQAWRPQTLLPVQRQPVSSLLFPA